MDISPVDEDQENNKNKTKKQKTRVITDSQDGRPSAIGSSIIGMKIMVKMRGVGTQSSRAGNQTGSLSSWAEMGFY